MQHKIIYFYLVLLTIFLIFIDAYNYQIILLNTYVKFSIHSENFLG